MPGETIAADGLAHVRALAGVVAASRPATVAAAQRASDTERQRTRGMRKLRENWRGRLNRLLPAQRVSARSGHDPCNYPAGSEKSWRGWVRSSDVSPLADGVATAHTSCVDASKPRQSFKVRLEELEASVRVPLDKQVETKAEPPPPHAVKEEWRRQQEMLRYASG